MNNNRLGWVGAIAAASFLFGCAAPEGGTDDENIATSEDALLGLGRVDCSRQNVPVKLSATATTTYNVAAWFCTRGAVDNVQVLVHGATYTHQYWDVPINDPQYSYVEWATAAGFATLSIDTLGAGESSFPNSLEILHSSQAYVVHQVITALRSGSLSPRHARPKRVALVGHSMGASVSVEAAATYPADIDALVTTGYIHSVGAGLDPFIASLYPAIYDPKFATSGLDPYYLTTLPGLRGPTFYFQPDKQDQRVLAFDEQNKSVVPAGMNDGYFANLFVPTAVKAPVFAVMGDEDTIFCPGPCSTTIKSEGNFYPQAKKFDSFVIPKVGHVINLHRLAPVEFAAIQTWLTLTLRKI